MEGSSPETPVVDTLEPGFGFPVAGPAVVAARVGETFGPLSTTYTRVGGVEAAASPSAVVLDGPAGAGSRRTRHLCRGRSRLAVLAHPSAVERLRSCAGLLDLHSRPQRRRSRLAGRGRADLASLVVRDRQRHAAPHARSRPVPAGPSATRLTLHLLEQSRDTAGRRTGRQPRTTRSAQSCGPVRRAGARGPRSSRRVAEVSTGPAVGSRPHRCGVSAVAAGFAAV